jgi:hypothetical protein
MVSLKDDNFDAFDWFCRSCWTRTTTDEGFLPTYSSNSFKVCRRETSDRTMFFTRRLLKIAEDELGRHLKLPFIDKLRVHVRAGRGGNGLKKYGGIGGQGGHILVRGQRHISLKNVYEKNLQKRYVAADGQHSEKRRLHGLPGDHRTILVPLGVQICRDNGELIDEINDLDDQCIVAHGGVGGNHRTFYEGQPGEVAMINFDLKLLADIG